MIKTSKPMENIMTRDNNKKGFIPSISVVIPLYNKAPHIRRTLDSVLNQTIQNFEIIVVGGNSNDGGEDIVRGYTDSRITLIKEAGCGVSAARNQGVAEAKSDLIAFLDADDEWLPEFLETILVLRNKYPNAGLYGTGRIVVNSDGQTPVLCHPELGDRLLDSYYKEKNTFVRMVISTSSSAVDKKIFQSISGWAENMRRAEDEDLFARLAYVSDVAYSPKPLSLYNVETVNNSYDIMTDMDSPFLEMVYKHSKNGNLGHFDLENLLLYADRLRMGIALRYLHTDKTKTYDYIKKMASRKYSFILSVAYILVSLHIISPDTIDSLLRLRLRRKRRLTHLNYSEK